ncbi:MAG: methylated-DNA--[Clostridia bacterium]|nr:methylated-DNA--[protein]-cysteine S-methyltransferase [Clostridia bacterium]
MAVRVMDECIGRLLVRDDGHGICEIRMLREGEDVADEMDSPLLNCAQAQLRAYFSGERQTFDLSVSVSGTPFEQAVWQRLCAIPYGETRTYAQIAAEMGKPKAARAVGAACGKNPVLIVVPCHRVVGSGGRLTGFAAGLDAKQRLLALEGHTVRNGRMV